MNYTYAKNVHNKQPILNASFCMFKDASKTNEMRTGAYT